MPFVEQPILEVVDTEGNHVNVTDVVTAAVEFNPTGYAVVQGSDFASVVCNAHLLCSCVCVCLESVHYCSEPPADLWDTMCLLVTGNG